MRNKMKQKVKRVYLACILCIVSYVVAGFSQENTADYILKAYNLTPQQENQFARDNRMSDFWNAWDNTAGVLDYIDMTPEVNGWVDGANSFSGSSDAELEVRAAYGESGLYLMFEVTDSTWIAGGEFHTAQVGDYLRIFLDILSSQEIRDANPLETYINNSSYGWTLTINTMLYEVKTGSLDASLADKMMMCYYFGSAILYNSVRLSQLSTDYPGLDFDMEAVSPTVRRMEWKIPWSRVGNNGGLEHMPEIGRLIALSGGYHDVDSVGQTSPKTLNWKERTPFDICEDYPTPHRYCDAWGDIEISSEYLPQLSITMPDANTVWYAGSAQIITWGEPSTQNAQLDYSTDNGQSWSNISTISVNCNSYTWLIPSGISSDKCIVRLIDYSDCYYIIGHRLSVYYCPPDTSVQSQLFTIRDTSDTVSGTIPAIKRNRPMNALKGTILRDRSTGALTFNISLASPGNLSIEIFDSKGKQVRRLDYSSLASGYHDIRWDGRNAQGQSVRNGCYYVRTRAGESRFLSTVVMAW